MKLTILRTEVNKYNSLGRSGGTLHIICASEVLVFKILKQATEEKKVDWLWVGAALLYQCLDGICGRL